MAKFNHIEVLPNGQVDPTGTTCICEGDNCRNEFILADAYSAVLVTFAMPGHREIASEQCPEYQHFCCSHECMVSAVTNCLNTHTKELVDKRHQDLARRKVSVDATQIS